MTGLPGSTELLISTGALKARTAELGAALTSELDGDEAPVLVGVLKGSTMFMADLIRAIARDVVVDFMAISSYGAGDTPSGVVRIVKDLDGDIEDKNVVIVEDIVDTGLTLTYLRRSLGARRPRSLITVTLLDKAARRIVPVPVEHAGFETPDVFVVGYGLDYQGRYRNLSAIYGVGDLGALVENKDLLVPDLYGRGV